MAHDRLVPVTRETGSFFDVSFEIAPAHERMFACVPDGPITRRLNEPR